MPGALLHVLGYLTGAALYAMLLWMVVRDRTGDRLTLGTALLGLGWNIGELLAIGFRTVEAWTASVWCSAGAFAALGFLAAVVVHSASRGGMEERPSRTSQRRALTGLAYIIAVAAGVQQFWAAARGSVVPAPGALVLMTTGLVALAPALILATRQQPNSRRAIWMMALAVFAVSALHLENFHVTQETWVVELLGHHASIPLAFAILYQDYRFALADLFLKQALTLVAVVSLVAAAWAAVGPLLMADPSSPQNVGLLLAIWVATTLLFPLIRSGAVRFVDRVVMRRADYTSFVDEVAAVVERCRTVEDVLTRSCEVLAPALSATAVTWEARSGQTPSAAMHGDITILTTESPRYALRVGPLAGGRRLLSDDLAMLERVSVLVARRVDALRLTEERYERMLRDREMQTLATEAELKALRAQINPHFLFNALTTIGYLIQAAPARALDTLMRLTTLLRGVLRSEGEFTTLGRELELIDSYLQIERERFEERLSVVLDVPADLRHLAIPALLVQPLVENAIKHGISGAREGGRVEVRAALDPTGRALRITVANTGLPWRGRWTGNGGIGLSNVERRLSCYYAAKASLTLSTSAEGVTVAELQVPVGDHESSRTVVVGPWRRR